VTAATGITARRRPRPRADSLAVRTLITAGVFVAFALTTTGFLNPLFTIYGCFNTAG